MLELTSTLFSLYYFAFHLYLKELFLLLSYICASAYFGAAKILLFFIPQTFLQKKNVFFLLPDVFLPFWSDQNVPEILSAISQLIRTAFFKAGAKITTFFVSANFFRTFF
jgi:hypothetical protein